MYPVILNSLMLKIIILELKNVLNDCSKRDHSLVVIKHTN